MKKIIKTAILFAILLANTALVAGEQAIYTITGKKDPRVSAVYTVAYVATNLKKGCGYSSFSSTGTMKPSIARRIVSVADGNYTINLPIYMSKEEDKNGCGYRFAGLELRMNRPNDGKFSRYQILGDYRYENLREKNGDHWSMPIYHGSGGGGMHSPYVLPAHETPMAFTSNKKYFRLTKKSTFTCMTFRPEKSQYSEEEKSRRTDFTCTLKMKLETEGGKYKYHECKDERSRKKADRLRCRTVTHPDFGVDEIVSDTLYIDIVVDESKCSLWKYPERIRERDIFREASKKKSSIVESIKSLF